MAGRSVAVEFFRGPPLSGNARRTFRLHLGYALLDATAGGILLNAPIVAIKAFQAANWHLPLRELFAGIGMIASLYLGVRMARRAKMPFVFIPGVLAGLCSVCMAAATGSAFWFLTLLGFGAMLEIVARPAVTSILRINYPVNHRGHATGEVRKWSSLAFVVSSVLSAWMLHWGAGRAHSAIVAEPALRGGVGLQWSADHMAQILMVLAGLLSLASFVCFRQIRVEEDLVAPRRDSPRGIGGSFREALSVLTAGNGRFRRYLLGCFLDGFCQMLYFPLIWAFLSRDLGFGYVGCSVLMHAVPALAAFAATGALGRVLDRTNPWISWSWIRGLWGLDAILLSATPACAALFPPALVVLPVLGRLLRGSVQGAWWIMWWQVGVTYFAPPGEDTSRYMGVMVFLNGAVRLLASAAGMGLAALSVPPGVLLIAGGVGVVLSAAYSLWQASWERRHRGPETMTEFEHLWDDESRGPSGLD
ncbi:MAG TPA: MFS transporter [Candidatus Anammoximicrobium sp.]|nr:MFS transporter [Candidatus Anammoximicrobium sp.]